MKSLVVKGVLLFCVFCTNLNAISLAAYPNPARHQGTGTSFMVKNNAGTYNFSIQILDGVGNVVKEFKSTNFVLKNGDNHVLQTWNLLNEKYRWVASTTYLVNLSMTNVQTGAITKASTKVAVASGIAESWITDMGVTKITDQYGDKIYRFPGKNQTIKKAIVHFKGWDPYNCGDGANECLSRYPLIKGTSAEIENGWDVYFVVWQDAGISLRTNVDRAIYLINKLNADYGPFQESVLIGFSMGGILGRYALAKSETQGSPLPVTKFISVEGEQQGAHINLSLQASITHIVNSGNPLITIGRFLGSMAEADSYKMMLYSQASKEMLYYHCGLVENYFKTGVKDECVFNTSQLDQIRLIADDWHDDFFNEIRFLGHCRGGYPSFSKNYAISMGTAEVPYANDKIPNQHMGTLAAVGKYRIHSDFQDLDQGAFVSVEDNTMYSSKNGYTKKLNFVRLESVLDLQNIDCLKSGNHITKKPTIEELTAHSRFDKIYIRPDGLRQDHQTFWDDLVWENIRDAIADQTPKGSCKPLLNNNTVNQILID